MMGTDALERQAASTRALIAYTACGTFLYAVCAGFRDSYGVLLPYIVAHTGIPYAIISFILALGQLCFGLMQPVFGLLALQTSNRFVLCTGAVMMFTGLLTIPFCTSAPALAFALGILLPSGTAAASFGIIMSCISPRLSECQGHTAGGFVAAGIGISICVLAPMLQSMVAGSGLFGAIAFLGCPILLLVPVSVWVSRGAQGKAGERDICQPCEHVADIFREALANPSYLCVGLAFFTCGFHMAMIQTHLFSQLTTFGVTEQAASYALSVYGLGVIAGAVGSGMACNKLSMSVVLAGLYGSRCLWVALLLLPLPMPGLFGVVFLLGLTGVATVPPTSGLIKNFFGSARLGTLFGLVYFAHQIGAFVSAWAGGLCLKFTGGYSGVWLADILLCMLAAIVCRCVREKPPSGAPPKAAEASRNGTNMHALHSCRVDKRIKHK